MSMKEKKSKMDMKKKSEAMAEKKRMMAKMKVAKMKDSKMKSDKMKADKMKADKMKAKKAQSGKDPHAGGSMSEGQKKMKKELDRRAMTMKSKSDASKKADAKPMQNRSIPIADRVKNVPTGGAYGKVKGSSKDKY